MKTQWCINRLGEFFDSFFSDHLYISFLQPKTSSQMTSTVFFCPPLHILGTSSRLLTSLSCSFYIIAQLVLTASVNTIESYSFYFCQSTQPPNLWILKRLFCGFSSFHLLDSSVTSEQVPTILRH